MDETHSVEREPQDDPLDRLPVTYATYLRLRAAGLGSAAIAAQLDVSVEALDLLEALAEAKLATLADEGDDGTG